MHRFPRRVMFAPVRAVLASGLLVAGLVSQRSVVVPAGSLAADGRSATATFLGGFEGRVQVLIDRSLLAGLAARPIRRIAVRRDAATDAALPGGLAGGWIDLTIRASWTSASARQPSRSFGVNAGRAPVVVFQRAYHVPDCPPLGRAVATFAAKESAHIQLQKPIAWSARGNLCLDFSIRPHASRPLPGPWVADIARPAPTQQTFFGQSCWRAGRKDRQANRMNADAKVGGTLTSWTLGPDASLAMFVLGASNTRWGPMPLPLDLGSVGAPGCRLYVSQDIVAVGWTARAPRTPHATVAFGLALPYVRSLAGSRVFSQWIFFDRKANSAGITTTNGASVLIAAAPKQPIAMVEADSATARVGRTSVGTAPVLRLYDN